MMHIYPIVCIQLLFTHFSVRILQFYEKIKCMSIYYEIRDYHERSVFRKLAVIEIDLSK